jgi:nucleoside-diphosphate-sugar epimerase
MPEIRKRLRFSEMEKCVMTVLITGGAGLIGSDLARSYLKREQRVVIFDIGVNSALEKENPKNLLQVKGDVSNWPEVLNVVKDNAVDTIFHLAARLTVASESNAWSCVNVNAGGTFNVLEAARFFGVKKLLFTSSIGSYGVTADTVVTEETIQRPTNIYGVTKVFSELLGMYYCKKFGLDFRGLRFPQIMGPGVVAEGIGQYNPLLIEAAIMGKPFEAWVPEDTIMPMIYIKDAVKSLEMLADAPETQLKSRIYGVGQIMPAPTANELVQEVKKYYPDAQVTFRPTPDAMKILANIPRYITGDCAEAEWGWKPSYSLELMVRDFIEEFKKQSLSKKSN